MLTLDGICQLTGEIRNGNCFVRPLLYLMPSAGTYTMFLTSRKAQLQLRCKASLVRGSGGPAPSVELWVRSPGWLAFRQGRWPRPLDGRTDRQKPRPAQRRAPQAGPPVSGPPCSVCVSFQNKACNVRCLLVSSIEGLGVWQGSEGPAAASLHES